MNTILTIFLTINQLISMGNMGVWNLKCDEKTNPVGVNPTEVSFSWESQASQRNIMQTDYRIVVSSSLDLLNKNKFDVWDSQKRASSESTHILYQGSPLRPATKYYWKVMIWNGKAKSSKWSDIGTFVTTLSSDQDWKGAKWIGLEEMPAADRLVPGLHKLENSASDKIPQRRATVPLFRKEFNTDKTIKEAYLFISGLGHYEGQLNGTKIGTDFLAPGWTHYDKRVLYNTYDITGLLNSGTNAIAVEVGNGFHYINNERYLKLGIAFGYPKMICRIKITYTDGSEQDIISNDTWKCAPSPITYSSIYGGEDYDARMEQPKWSNPGFNDSNWKKAVCVTPPAGKLYPELGTPVKLFESFPYTKVQPTGTNQYTFDFGQNASATFEVKLSGKKGSIVRFKPGELIDFDGNVNQRASGSPNFYTYTLKGEGIETWRPKFTYYGFRYITVEGARPEIAQSDADLPVIHELSLVHNRNSAPQVGSFECSSDLMNRIFTLIDWAIRSNLQSVATDCPHREKLGWLEQTYLMGNSIRYNYSLYHLYRKQVQDMIDSQLDNGLVPDIAPEYVEFQGGFRDSPEWGSAAVIMPWMVYKWYGDKQILTTAYPMMCRYVEYLKSKSANHILSHGLGDWFDYGPKAPGEAQLTPKALTATAIYYYDVKLLSEIAKVIGKDSDVVNYTSWSEEIKKSFNNEFFDATNKNYATGSQTALSMPLCVGLVDESERDAVINTLNQTIENEEYKLTAGDIGFHYLVAALSDAGNSEALYKLINRDDVPGYGFQLAKGATALTESWPALEQVSNNHLMLGHIMEWFYTCLLGIKDAPEAVASNKMIIAPTPVGDITWAKGSHQTPKGKIEVSWKIESNGNMTLDLKAPSNMPIVVIFPQKYQTIEESFLSVSNRTDTQIVESKDGKVHIAVNGGNYTFTAR